MIKKSLNVMISMFFFVIIYHIKMANKKATFRKRKIHDYFITDKRKEKKYCITQINKPIIVAITGENEGKIGFFGRFKRQ